MPALYPLGMVEIILQLPLQTILIALIPYFYYSVLRGLDIAMENYLEYELKLDQLLLTFDEPRKVSDEGCEAYGLALLSCPKDFKGRFSRCLLSAKKRISEIVHQKRADLKETNIASLKSFIKSLVMPSSVLLNELILNLYTGMVDLAEYSKKVTTQQNNIGINEHFATILKAIIKELSPLLFYFFVNKEHIKRLKSISTFACCSYSKISSEKSISSMDISRNKSGIEHQESDQQAIINQIQEEFSAISISGLIEKYLKEQENLIVDSIEVCRVCSQKVKLRNFEKHVKKCSKKAKMKSDLSELEVRRKSLEESVKQLQKQIIRKTEEPTQRDKHILKILAMLKNAFLASRKQGGIKRNTFIGGIKAQPIEDIKYQIQQFQKRYEPDNLIRNFVKSKQEIILIRKKLLTVEMNEKVEEDSLYDSDIYSIKSLEFSINNAKSTHHLKTKKSLFAKVSNGNSKKQKISKSGNQSQSQSNSSSSKSQNISIGSGNSIDNSGLNFLGVDKNTKKQKDRSPSQIQPMKRSGPISRYPFQDLTKNQTKSMRNIHPIEDIEQTVGLRDFQILKILGKGAFGQVYLVRRKITCDLYALKHIKFEQNQTEIQLNLIKKQHQIFKKIGGDHLIRAPFAFSQSSGHFFVLQFMPGGDLSKILSQNVYLQQDNARFYLAEIVLALQHLHKCQIIHRDLKPENIVIQKSGHIKLTDFGLSDIKIQDKLIKVKAKLDLTQRRTTMQRSGRRVALVNKTDIAKIIGTPDYIAPQIINQTSINNNSIDWWSLGVMAYEMLVGCRPFSALTIEEVLKNILDCKIQWPEIGRQEDMMSPQAYDLISRLLDKNFQKRIGSFSCEQIKNHPFFKSIDWQNIRHQKPPILPHSELDHLKQYMSLVEDKQLLSQITSSCKPEQSRNKKIDGLQNFVRYDVLMQETYESIDQKLKNQKRKMQRIKNVSSFLQKESQNILANPYNEARQEIKIKGRTKQK